LVQTRGFIRQLAAACPDLAGPNRLVEHVIATTGDAVQDRPLAEIGGKGLFAKEIHEALLDGRIDFAVHSLKDLETELPPGIVLGCVLRREDPRDALILGPALDGAADDPLAALPPGALVGTSSVRRQAQLLRRRPDLRITVMRGNVETRLRKLAEGVCQASLLAMAGLNRLGMAVSQARPLPPALMLPAVAQGIVGITVRAGDADLRARLALIEDANSRVAADAERAMLARLDGSCRTPLAGYADLLPEGTVRMTGLVARVDGSFLLRRTETGPRSDAVRLGMALGDRLRAESPADLFA
jgi:hydroxymethylbilane synthase